MGHLDQAAEALAVRHERELTDLEGRVALTGERGSGRKNVTNRHKRDPANFVPTNCAVV